MPELNEKITELTPEEETTLPVEEPTPEGEVPEETSQETAEATPEAMPVQAPETPDYKSLYEKSAAHGSNLEKLAGKWANEVGAMRAQIRQEFQNLPKVQETYDPASDYEKFTQDPRKYVQTQAPAPEQYVKPLQNEVYTLKFQLAHPDYFQGGKMKPEIVDTVEEIVREEPWLQSLPDSAQLSALAPLIRIKEIEKGMQEGLKERDAKLSAQTVKTGLAKQKAKLASTGGVKYEKPLGEMSLEEMDKVLPHSDRPLE